MMRATSADASSKAMASAANTDQRSCRTHAIWRLRLSTKAAGSSLGLGEGAGAEGRDSLSLTEAAGQPQRVESTRASL